MGFRYLDNIALGIGLIIMSIVTFFVLPRISNESAKLSPLDGIIWVNLIASGILFGLGVVFIVVALKNHR